MRSPCKKGLFLLLTISAFLPKSSYGRTIVKRSPQLSLTVIDDSEDEVKREHPPSPEDIEERRQKLVKALAGEGGGGGQVGSQLQTLSNLGVDLLSGGRTAELFAPLFNATRQATANFPRVGDVINRVVDSTREYRKTARAAWRENASSKINNGVRVFSTFTARATEVFGGIFKLLRTLLDNLTYTIQNLARGFSTGLVRTASTASSLLTRGFASARGLLNNQRLFQPAKDVAELGGNLVRGLAQDFTSLQPAVSEGIQTKLRTAPRLIPRIRLTSILSPLGEKEPCNNDDGGHEGEESVDIGDGGYGKKRGSGEGGDDSGEEDTASIKPMSLEDIPKDVLELLESSKSETKANPDGSGEGTTIVTPKPTKTTEKSKSEKKTSVSSKKSTTVKPTTTTETPSTTEASKTTAKKSTTAKTKSTASSSTSSGERTSFVEDLFGLSDKST